MSGYDESFGGLVGQICERSSTGEGLIDEETAGVSAPVEMTAVLLDISNDVGGVKGAVLWRSSRPLTPLFTPYAWSRERSVMFFIELRSLTARFFGLGQSCMGLCSNCIVLTAHCVVVKIVEDSRPHPSVCGHRLRPGLPSRTPACARGQGAHSS